MRLHCLYFTCNVPLERKPEKLLMHPDIAYKSERQLPGSFINPNNLLGNPSDWINEADYKSSIICI